MYHAAKGRAVVSVPGGLNLVHIDDVVAGHLAAAKVGRAGERYILGGHNLPMTDILRATARITGPRPPLAELPLWICRALTAVMDGANRAFNLRLRLTVLRMAGRFFYYDISKARRELGLGEPRSWEDAVREAWEWYRERGML